MSAAPTDCRRTSALFTDLYELTMAAGYLAEGLDEPAVFSLFVRASAHRNFFVAAGVEEALDGIEAMRFSDGDIAYLRRHGLLGDRFLKKLRDFRFSGSIRALPEGTVFFPEEPVLEVTAPIGEAQILETYLINTVGFQTLITTKAARCVHAAGGRTLIDFSLRRTQARDAGMKVARSTYVAGFAATSNVLAGKCYGIPIAGTMAHSFVGAFDSETAAFEAYARAFPDTSVFLIDTYDTIRGAQNAARVGLEMRRRGKRLVGVRLDSGDIAALSREVRRILDAAGLDDVKIFVSGNFDEYRIAEVLRAGAPVDAFGVGTRIGVSADEPSLDMVYKMVRHGGRDVCKRSPGKRSLAGEKQVFRLTGADGRYRGDVIGTPGERPEGAQPLLRTVMRAGRRLAPPAGMETVRAAVAENCSRLEKRLKTPEKVSAYPVRISPGLRALQPEGGPEAE